jgi:type IV secretory pathway TrbL component
MSKYTASGVESQLKSMINEFHNRAHAVKDSYYAKRQDILRNDRLSDSAKTSDLAELGVAVSAQLTAIKAQQDAYVSGLKNTLEKELRGDQPQDDNSVLLRRDAADRARKIADEWDALAVLKDAVYSGDNSLAHALGYKARQEGWTDLIDAYREAQPASGDVATALAFVEDATSAAAFNLGNQMTYADPAA